MEAHVRLQVFAGVSCQYVQHNRVGDQFRILGVFLQRLV